MTEEFDILIALHLKNMFDVYGCSKYNEFDCSRG